MREMSEEIRGSFTAAFSYARTNLDWRLSRSLGQAEYENRSHIDSGE